MKTYALFSLLLLGVVALVAWLAYAHARSECIASGGEITGLQCVLPARPMKASATVTAVKGRASVE